VEEYNLALEKLPLGVVLRKPDIEDELPPIGTKCRHNGCERKYEGPHSEGANCNYHPGMPVFHEGEKYWSCCKKKTISFIDFLSMPGCATGHCVFKETISTRIAKKVPKHDMTESNTNVYFAVYAKLIDPKSIKVTGTRDKLRISFYWNMGVLFDIEIGLKGPIIPTLCTAEVSSKMIELNLRKGDGTTWGQVGMVYDAETGLELHQKEHFAIPDIPLPTENIT